MLIRDQNIMKNILKKDLIKQMCGVHICQDIPCIITKLLGLSSHIPQLIIQDFLMVLINIIFELTFINKLIKIIIYKIYAIY